MRCRCPHCHSPIEIVDDESLGDMECPSCGSQFRLIDAQSTLPLPGEHKKIAHFELLQQVGMGKFGSVWKARDTQLDRIVAVKIPRAEQLNEAEAEQFFREARAAAQVKHASIVGVHEVGRQNGTLYIVSDFIDGANLRQWLSNQRLSFREASELCATLAEALHEAHEAGVVHRDLKPGNIMIDLDGQPHISDFGLAKREAGEITMTVDGRILGTPAYMSPEQARGQAHEADRRSDIYSLGVILYELLTGELPFRGERQMLLVQILRDEPTPPRKLNNRIPRDLETICLKCMEKEPARRYATSEALAYDLRRYLNGDPILARPIGIVERTARRAKRHPALAALIVTSVVAVVAFVVAGVSYAYQSQIEAAYRAEKGVRQQAQQLALKNEQLAASERRQRRELQAAQESLRAALRQVGKERDVAERATVQAVAAKALADQAKQDALDARNQLEKLFYLRLISTIDRQLLSIERIRTLASSLKEQERQEELAAARKLLQEVDGRLAECPQALRRWEWYFLKGKRRQIEMAIDGREVDMNSAVAMRTIQAHEASRFRYGMGYGLSISADGQQIASTGSDGVKLWDMKKGDLLHHWDNINPFSGSVSFSPDGKLLLVGGQSSELKLFDLDTKEERRSLEGKLILVYGVAWAPDSRRFASAHFGLAAVVWDAKTFETLYKLGSHGDYVKCVAFSADSNRIATASRDGKIRIWDAATGKHQLQIDADRSTMGVETVAFSPDGKTIAGGGRTWLKIWDAASSEELKSFVGHIDAVECVAFSPEGTRLASGGKDSDVRLWDVDSGEPLLTLEGHSGAVTAVAFSSDGRRLTSSAIDGTIRIWDRGPK